MDAWQLRQATQWNYCWDFSGAGIIIGEIRVSEVKFRNGRMEQEYSHKTAGRGAMILDEQSLMPIGTFIPPR